MAWDIHVELILQWNNESLCNESSEAWEWIMGTLGHELHQSEWRSFMAIVFIFVFRIISHYSPGWPWN